METILAMVVAHGVKTLLQKMGWDVVLEPLALVGLLVLSLLIWGIVYLVNRYTRRSALIKSGVVTISKHLLFDPKFKFSLMFGKVGVLVEASAKIETEQTTITDNDSTINDVRRIDREQPKQKTHGNNS